MADPLFSLRHLTLRIGGHTLLKDVSWQIDPGQQWAIVGPNGSGKSVLLRLLAGQLAAPVGSITRKANAEWVEFREESRQFSYTRHFYQQRYQASMSDAGQDGQPIPTLREFLGLPNGQESNLYVQHLGLADLLDRTFLKLSNGQTRRSRIAKALLHQPQALLLDNPFVGVDTHFCEELNLSLTQIAATGTTLVLTCEPHQMPDFVTHVAVMAGGMLAWAGAKDDFTPAYTLPTPAAWPVWQTKPQPADFDEAFRLVNVNVQYGGQKLLQAINWTVRAGERWALLGHNGAGKSVLLSLLYGDHPQAYANEIYVFGHRRGRPGQSIWDVKRRIGFVSPELHLYFPQHLSVRDVILTGLTDTLAVPARIDASAEADLMQGLAYFNLNHRLHDRFGHLSTGQQRVVLLLRALIKNPPVLILDEPFQAMDAPTIQRARRLLDTLPQKTMLFVTHDPAELPTTVNRLLRLETGKVIAQTPS